ncbi:hypothetical protein EUGRSUZ_L01941 [Eucalyptus grandis]|uniref:Sulfite exporter TauE/SafE family protein n=1 Tax=Eucalyptus grandis TaxID=71139 RepID=A0A058ZRX4_EUCGR|nr:hypothetical protein EUGRSUZ_L01941 [Eucalyptus grandis]
MVQAGVLRFVAAAVSSAGAMGGGGLFVPILAIFAGLQLKTASTFSAFMVTGLQLKTASSFSAFMVTGVSIPNVIYYLIIKSPQFGGKCLIDYDIALLSEPCLLLGVSIGVICNVVFPEWLITMLFASEGGREIVHLEKGSVREEAFGGSEEAKVAIEPVLHDEPNCQDQFPWMKLGVLVLVWFSFFSVHIFRGNQHVQSIIPVEPCGPDYWLLSSDQIPLAVAFTSWTLIWKESIQNQVSSQQDVDDPNREGPANILIFPVTAATCSFMVFFSSTMSALQYLVLGMEHQEIALIFSFTCFVTSLLGIIVVQRAVRLYGRASLIMFSMTIVMASSTVLIAGFGAIEIWKDYISGKFMGFKPPC